MRRARLVPALIAASLFALTSSGCTDPREGRCRAAVKQLVEATPQVERALRTRVASYGRYALVEIEQAMHAAAVPARLRLLEAVLAIGTAEALPLLAFLARRDADSVVRARAAQVMRSLAQRPRAAER